MAPFHTLQETARAAEVVENASLLSGEQFLLVASRGALYAIDAARVREVHALPALIFLPQAPRFVAGVVNVRGANLPVVDLASRLGQTPQTPRLNHGLVVLQMPDRCIALWVEEVRDIIFLPTSQMESAPFANEHSIVSHMTQLNGEVVLLLQTQHLLNDADFAAGENNGIDSPSSEIGSDSNAKFIDEATQKTLRARAKRLAQSSLQTAQTSSHLATPLATSLAASETTENVTAVARVVLGGEERGVVLTQIREFCALGDFTPVPCSPPHIVGQMNLRGEVVTLLDIAPRLGMARQEIGVNERGANEQGLSQVVVVKREAMRGEEAGLVGVVVEEVRDVLQLHEHEMRALPASASRLGDIHSAILHDERWIPVLDLHSILADADLVVDELV